MSDSTLASKPRIKIGGIKFSQELTLFSCSQAVPGLELSDTVTAIAARSITLCYFSLGTGGGGQHLALAVEAAQAAPVGVLLQAAMGKQTLNSLAQVAILSLFPHGGSLTILGDIVSHLIGRGIAVHAFCTSISALSLVIDYNLLDQAAAILQEIVALPANHAPFRQDPVTSRILP